MLVVALTACERGRGVEQRFVLRTPHEQYAALLAAAGLEQTALGREWLRSATASLREAGAVSLPHREIRYLDPAEAAAAAYRMTLERGQLVRVAVDAAGLEDSTRVFVDLFVASPAAMTPTVVASADSGTSNLEYVALHPGVYVVRVQPELLRGGRFTITVSAHASLDFPVAGRDMAAIRSKFGAPRDGGRRDHQGVDIFARRGTPVLASAAGRARAGTNRLGGNVIWLRDTAHGRSLYYAHLDRHAFEGTRIVAIGDTLGFVGNSGNARTTPPHLHFGIYMRRIGPVDPTAHLYEPTAGPEEFDGDARLVGAWGRTVPRSTDLRAAPSRQARVLADLDVNTPFEILAGTGAYYYARLPGGGTGYVPVRSVEAGVGALADGQVITEETLRAEPAISAPPRETVTAGAAVHVFGAFGGYTLVRTERGVAGWVPTSALTMPRAEATAEN
ncbi:MAG TPA: peptidoglycan DD-metalloendopeptidase family protein [Gemmatimonadales bacterium]|jgi:murein DD-endopeptidase MepM/ murein hydrolase activator NlpD